MASDTLSDQVKRRGIRFSLGNMLLLVAIVALAIALFLTYRKLDRMEQLLSATQPLTPQEVAQQVEKQTSVNSLVTTVKDVRYSKTADAYSVSITWPGTGGTTYIDVRLKGDGFGRYYGKIYSTEFLSAAKYKGDAYSVVVATPSPFDSK